MSFITGINFETVIEISPSDFVASWSRMSRIK